MCLVSVHPSEGGEAEAASSGGSPYWRTWTPSTAASSEAWKLLQTEEEEPLRFSHQHNKRNQQKYKTCSAKQPWRKVHHTGWLNRFTQLLPGLLSSWMTFPSVGGGAGVLLRTRQLEEFSRCKSHSNTFIVSWYVASDGGSLEGRSNTTEHSCNNVCCLGSKLLSSFHFYTGSQLLADKRDTS